MGRARPYAVGAHIRGEAELRSAWTLRLRSGQAREAPVPTRPRPHTISLPDHYFGIVPQAMRSPALPAGSVFWSSAFAWITSDVPPLLNSEWLSLPSVTSLFSALKCALPSAPTVKLGLSPAWWPSGFSNPCFLPSGLKWGPADLKSGASPFAF